MHTFLLLWPPAAMTRQFLSSHHIDSYQPPTHNESPHQTQNKSLQKSPTHHHHHRLYEACSEVFGLSDKVLDCGKMFQKEMRSLDETVSIECSSGSIIVRQTIFNCIKNNYHRFLADKRATNRFQRICHKKVKCKLNLPEQIEKMYKHLHNSFSDELICHKKAKMWLVFSCLGGENKTSDLVGTGHQHHDHKTCSESAGRKGNIIKKSIPGLGGWIHLKCPGGCLTIHKVRWGCRYESTAQLRIVRELCQGKKTCRIDPGRRL